MGRTCFLWVGLARRIHILTNQPTPLPPTNPKQPGGAGAPRRVGAGVPGEAGGARGVAAERAGPGAAGAGAAAGGWIVEGMGVFIDPPVRPCHITHTTNHTITQPNPWIRRRTPPSRRSAGPRRRRRRRWRGSWWWPRIWRRRWRRSCRARPPTWCVHALWIYLYILGVVLCGVSRLSRLSVSHLTYTYIIAQMQSQQMGELAAAQKEAAQATEGQAQQQSKEQVNNNIQYVHGWLPGWLVCLM